MNKKLISCFLLLLMVFHSAGFYLVFELNRFLVKREMAELLASNSNLKIEKITVKHTSSSIRIIGKNELEYNNRMYDVLYSTNRGGITTYYCVHDSKEDNINTRLGKMMKDQTKNLLIPVFGSIAVLCEKGTLAHEPGKKFKFLPYSISILPVIRLVPEYPPESC